MNAPSRVHQQMILRHAAGYVELAEMLVDGESPLPPSGHRLLLRALRTLEELPADTRGLADASRLEGEALRALGDWQQAIGPLTRAAEEAPGRLEAWLGLGWCLKRLGRLDEAIHALERGRDASPRQAIVLYNLACYHSLAGNVPAAIENLTQAIAIDDRYRDLTGTERDFDPIRTDPRFQAATHVTV
ncbi:MAG: TPR end-of-group domain-containing protein [Planctomycetia bacterium]